VKGLGFSLLFGAQGRRVAQENVQVSGFRVQESEPVRLKFGPDQEKSDIFKASRFEPLYQPYFGFFLVTWSRYGRIVHIYIYIFICICGRIVHIYIYIYIYMYMYIYIK